jgi:putative ABC transport system permease protein
MRLRFNFPFAGTTTRATCNKSAPPARTWPTATAGAAIAGLASSLDADLRFEAIPLDRLLRMWILPSRVAAAGAGVLGLVALALASIGIYGVLAYLVSQRTREIGVRMALGARPADLVRLVLREGAGLIGAGAVIGTLIAAAAAPLLRALLFGISAYDPVAFAAAALVLIGVAVAACYVPARRASRLEPVAALRIE